MASKKYKPTSPGRRFVRTTNYGEVTKTRPERKLTESQKRSGGRNNRGRMTVRRRGGGHKRRYRSIDFKRNKIGVPADVAAIEYDPNRSAFIALLHYADGEKSYILGWPARTFGRLLGTVDGKRRPLRPPQAALWRAPSNPPRVPCHGWLGVEPGAREPLAGQGRPLPLVGQAPVRAWCRHEPRRPPSRWS